MEKQSSKQSFQSTLTTSGPRKVKASVIDEEKVIGMNESNSKRGLFSKQNSINSAFSRNTKNENVKTKKTHNTQRKKKRTTNKKKQ